MTVSINTAPMAMLPILIFSTHQLSRPISHYAHIIGWALSLIMALKGNPRERKQSTFFFSFLNGICFVIFLWGSKPP